MADQNNTIKSTVVLDVNSAQREIVKLNAAASDSTKTLEQRIGAKNKQVAIQNELSDKTIDDLEKEVKELEELGEENKQYQKALKKLNSEKLKATKLSENNAKQQNKLNEALSDSKSATKQLDNATGGLIEKFKALATNPIVLVITALVGIFKLFQQAIQRSAVASEAFAKIGATISGIFNGFLAVLEPVVEFLGNALVSAIEAPGKAWDSFVSTLESGYNFIKDQIITRFSANWTLLSKGIQAGILKMRIAWNNFTGDSEEAEQLTEELEGVKESIREAQSELDRVNQVIVDGFNRAVDAVTKFAETAVEKYDEAARATEALANAERRLSANRILLEKQQLTSLRLAEEQRQIRDDTSRSIEERIEANTRLGKILDAQAKRELAIAQQNLDIARLRVKAEGETIENLEAVGDAEIKLLEIQERITGQRSEQLVNRVALEKEAADKILDISNRNFDAQFELEELAIERRRARGEEVLEDEIALMRKRMLRELENEELTEKERALIKQKFRDEEELLRLEAEERELEDRRARQEALLELDEIELERLREKGKNTLELELAILEKRRQQEVSQADLTAEEILAINTRAEFEKQKLRDASEKAEKEKNKAELESTINSAAEAFGIAQEVALAELIIKAPEAVGNSFERASARYAPPLSLVMGALGAAGTLAPIVKGIADIKKTRFSKSKGGSPSGGNVSTSVGGAAGAATGAGSVTPELISDISANNASRLGLDTDIGSAATATASQNVTGSTSGNVVFSENRYNDFQRQVSFKEDKTSL